jgi:hypothetical protein
MLGILLGLTICEGDSIGQERGGTRADERH